MLLMDLVCYQFVQLTHLLVKMTTDIKSLLVSLNIICAAFEFYHHIEKY